MPRRPSHDQLIHCESCGEDYSATYRKCPFCGARNAPRRPDPEPEYEEPVREEPVKEEEEYDDGYVFDGQDLFDDEPESHAPSKGGKRLAGGGKAKSKARGGGDGDEPDPPAEINLPRLITFLCSLVIIVAALVIVFTIVYPQLHKNKGKDKDPTGSQPPAVSQPVEPSGQPSQPAAPSGEPAGSAEPGTEPSSAPSGEPSSAPSQDVPASQSPAAGETLKDFTPSRTPEKGFTLNENESYQVTLTFDPAGWSGDVTWSISDTRYATVSDNGTVTNVNKDAKLHGVYLTVTAGGISKEIPVYCKASSTPVSSEAPSAEPSSAPSGGSSGGSVSVGKEGTIVDAEEGLRVRSGPGTTYDVLASLRNGDSINVVKDAGDGWYEIVFHGSGGQETTGYIMGDYISTD